ncbi:N(6)-adenine-specific DNA methyltransferase [Sclerotinia borealis F-4128]|uniref:Protein-lysine N-methyltransferase EFM5 n=1 Tax=Sclerotinia borealis (strain F-4128) TaxID=1432307 RepID=W9CJ40_SCLBF|nr:N(6)-adenine-specific DNA methyltransferase [Sclerotinia borealis F-4128]
MENTKEDDIPILSGSALDALKEFYTDRDAHQQKFEDLKQRAEDQADGVPLSMDAFAENWNESQFWYSNETATILAQELLRDAVAETVITSAICLSVMVMDGEVNIGKAGWAEDKRPKLHLLEFDERFAVFSEFSFYDFNNPLMLPAHLKGSADRVICDPPFLSEDCQTKAALTVRWLSKSWGQDESLMSWGQADSASPSKLIVCTGERVGDVVNKLYRPQGIATTTYLPIHANGLSNEFFCFANFECEHWTWRKLDEE